nr:histidine kinase [Streptococcus pseudoporcinus]
MSQDLHDTLGHVFVMLTIKADLVQTLLGRGEVVKAQEEVADLQTITKHAMQNVRQIVGSLKDHQIAQELVVIRKMLELAGVDFHIEGESVVKALPTDLQSKTAMILRELVNNLMKHSQAKKCSLRFNRDQNHVYLFYHDDVLGFSDLDGQELHSIKERLIPLQGQVRITSLSKPTEIIVSIPIKE